MRMTTMTLTAALGLSLVAGPPVYADYDRLQNAATMVREMAAASDNGIPESLFAKAKCVALIPGVKKAALGVGGQFGRGYLSCRNGSGWSAPGAVRIEGGSIGLQIGGTDTDLILLVLNDRGVDRLLSSKFTIGADAAVAAGPVGRQATAQTDATMMAEMLAWSRSRGVFAGVSLHGSTLREDASENRDNYGKSLTNREIVKGSVEPPKGATELLAALAKY